MKKYELYKQIDSNEIRTIQLNLLKKTIDLCNEYGITYYMAYGSLLGTIRHQGFIPWDDDIDIMIKREDIDRLVKASYDRNIRIINSSLNKKYFSPLIKIYDPSTMLIQEYGQVEGINIGVYIDVFVLDNVPDNEDERIKFYKRAERIRKYWGFSCRKITKKSKSIIRTILGLLYSIPFKIMGYKYWAAKYDKYASSIISDSKGIVVYGEGFLKEYVYHQEDLVTINAKFEDLIVTISCSYNKILTKCYGNYMKIPPLEERKKHSFKAYYLEEKNENRHSNIS